MSDTPFNISIDAAKGIANIELGRPATGNKLTAPEVADLGRAIRTAGSRKDVKVVVVRAKGDAFCLGRAPGSGPAPANALELRTVVAEPILSLYADVRATEVPVMAVVQGPAMGFGSAFVAVCDLAIASDKAKFAFTEMEHNLPPTLAMSAAIDKIPAKLLMHMVLTRAELTAADAKAAGLISEATTAANLDAAVQATLAKLVDRDRSAMCCVKEYLLAALRLDAASSARLAANAISVVLSSQAKH